MLGYGRGVRPGFLDDDGVARLRDVLLAVHGYRRLRGRLLAGADTAWMRRIPEADAPAEQIDLDLDHLNGARGAPAPQVRGWFATYLRGLERHLRDDAARAAVVAALRARVQAASLTAFADAPVPPSVDLRWLRCDREPQRVSLVDQVGAPAVRLTLLTDADHDAHGRFVDLVEGEPLARYRFARVDWGGERSRGAADHAERFERAVRAALDDAGTPLPDLLRSASALAPLVVGCSLLRRELHDHAGFVEFATEHLPRLTPPDARLLLLQPVGWSAVPWWRRWFGRTDHLDTIGKAQAMARALAAVGPSVEVLSLPELRPITRADVQQFAERALTARGRAGLTPAALALKLVGRGDRSADVYENLRRWLAEP